jgi:hypothetical protein
MHKDLDAMHFTTFSKIPPFKTDYDDAFRQTYTVRELLKIQGIYVLDSLCVCNCFLIPFLGSDGR